MIEYKLDLTDRKSLNRIKSILDTHYEILTLLNEDSKESVKGGAIMNYDITIKLKEMWS